MTPLRRNLPPLSTDHARIADGQYDDEPWIDMDPEIVDLVPRVVPRSGHRRKPPTKKQRARMERNAVIAAAHKAGISQRVLSRVFDLPRSVIGEIVQGGQLCGRRRDDGDGEP